MAVADLHIHSTASDGLLAPEAVVMAAKACGVLLIALTDHDTTAGLAAAQAAGGQAGVRVIAGLELSCDLDGAEVHILGYRIDRRSSELQTLLAQAKAARGERLQEMVRRLAAFGLELDWREIRGQTAADSLGRPHIARAMLAKGYVGSVKEAFSRWLGVGCPAFVPRFKLHPAEAIEIIHTAGGLAFLAHPGLLADVSLAPAVAKLGLDGIEIYHPQHRRQQVQHFLTLATELKLLVSGGSDFHGGPGERLAAASIPVADLFWLADK